MEDSQKVDVQKNTFLRWGGKLFIAFAFLLPVFFIPSQVVTFPFSKGFFLVISILVLTFIFLVGVLKEGKVALPKSLTLLGLLAIVLASATSAIFSIDPALSLLGQGFEIDTTFFVLMVTVLAILVPSAFHSKTSLFNIYLALLGAFFLTVLFNIVRFFAPDLFSFNIFNNSVANLIGAWNDLGVFAGFITLFSLISLGVLETKGAWRLALRVALVLGVVFLAIVNFNVVWAVVAAFSLVFFLYSISFARSRGDSGSVTSRIRSVSWAPVIVLAISVVFLLVGDTLGGRISSWLSVSQLEARPSWSTTVAIGKEVLSQNPIFGTGPNQFVREWLLHKPQAVNESLFWSVDFSSGIGTIPTAFITSGLLGALAWIIFFILFAVEGVRAIRRLHGDVFAHYLAFSSFVGSLYFWISAIFYTPGHVMYTMAFLFTGIFVATLVLEGVVEEKKFNFSDSPGKSFIGSLVTIVLLIGVVTCGYIAVERFSGFAIFNKAVTAYASDRNLDLVEERVKRSLLIENSDAFFRTLSEIYLARLQEIASKQPKDSEVEALRVQFQQYLVGAVSSAQAATEVNPNNYQNWVSLARVYESVVPLKIDRSYEEALSAYGRAEVLNPKSPAISLAKARLELAKGDRKVARDFIAQSLQKKSNYTDAIFLLTQLEVEAGDVKKAIEAATSGVLLAPNNPALFFQLGLLHYNDRGFGKAIEALEQAVRLEPQYANARYFLGISYDRVGRGADAIAQFEEIQKTNADNAEIKAILDNLRDGRPALSQAKADIDDEPEKRDDLPVSESAKNR